MSELIYFRLRESAELSNSIFFNDNINMSANWLLTQYESTQQ